MFQHDLIWLNQFSKKVNTLFVLCKPTLAYCLYFYDHFLSVEKKGLRYASGKLDGAGAARRRGRCTCPLVASRPSFFFNWLVMDMCPGLQITVRIRCLVGRSFLRWSPAGRRRFKFQISRQFHVKRNFIRKNDFNWF